MNGIFLTFLAFASLAVAGMKTYSVNLFEPAMLGSTELRAGDYQLQVDGIKVVIRTGKTTAEVPVRVENGDSKYSSTTVRLSESGGKQHITEIRLGGTTTRLIVGE